LKGSIKAIPDIVIRIGRIDHVFRGERVVFDMLIYLRRYSFRERITFS
jgi:hypothetical protein